MLQHLLAQQGEQIFVAAVPVMQEAPEGQEEGEEAEAVSVHLHDIAAAARVLQMSHNTQARVLLCRKSAQPTQRFVAESHFLRAG